ncbi:MAG: oligoribonuclease [Polyangiales bacterium]
MTSSIVWMDLEMTGLDPDKERIIEIAVLITDAQLNIIAEGPDLVIHQPDDLLNAMDEWNTTHHGESGLIERVRTSEVSEEDAVALVYTFLKMHVPERKAPLAGNSVHQDRRFLSKYMPDVENWLHYRNIEVSTVKELAMRWYPEEHAQRPAKRGNHRAMDDIKESIEELQYYRKALFRDPKG